MPIVNIDLNWLNRLLEQDFPPEVISESLEQIGCDVEDIVDLKRSRCSNCGSLVENPLGQDEVKACGLCGFESETPFPAAGSVKVVRLDLLAARPDLFDVGGLARALRGTLDLAAGLPAYPIVPSGLKIRVDSSVRRTESYHPHIQCAVMTFPAINESTLVAIMKLQENLHWGVARDRRLASIGVYDMDTITGDIEFSTLHPDQDSFVPLGNSPGETMTGRGILEKHPKGMAYAHLLDGHDRYPVLRDQAGLVLSMPPIINSEETRLKLGSERLFIDVTGASRAAVIKCLDTLVCSLVELGGSLQSVEIIEDDSIRVSPDLSPRSAQVDLEEAKRWLGLPLDADALMNSMRRMRFDIEPTNADSTQFRVDYPPYRTDIRHMVDLLEDIAIGFGYGNIEPRLVPSMTVGQARPEETLSERVRATLIGLGFGEVMSLPLTTGEQHFERFRQATPMCYPQIANPKLKAYSVLRTHLKTGLVECLFENRRRPLPLKIFEIDNVVDLDDEAPTGTSEDRCVAFAEMGREAGYASMRAAVDALLRELGEEGRYAPIEDPTFVSGRAASITTEGGFSGVLGELHPEVLVAFGLNHPVSLAEIRLSRIC